MALEDEAGVNVVDKQDWVVVRASPKLPAAAIKASGAPSRVELSRCTEPAEVGIALRAHS